MWLPLSELRILFLVRLTANLYSVSLINKNTRFLQAPPIEKEISKVKAYGVTRQISLEFLSIMHTLLHNTTFQVDFLRKKDYLALFNFGNRVNFFNDVNHKNIFKGNGFLLYSSEAELAFFLSLLDKITANTKTQFLLVSYQGLFIDQKRAVFLSKAKDIFNYYRFFIFCLNQALLFACNFLNQALALTSMFLYDLLTFFLKNFFFFNLSNNSFRL